MGQEEHPPIAQIQNWTFYFFLTKQISVRRASPLTKHALDKSVSWSVDWLVGLVGWLVKLIEGQRTTGVKLRIL